tara:strand:- start:359 stop:559 length:201 start_codon:yes stop_codon:yes gene_type:complete
MAFPVTGYVVFILYIDTNKTHIPQFETMDEAELFANEMRAATAHCIISEPYPVVLTEHKKKELLEI